MKVIVNRPAPVTPPPSTIDIVGIPYEDAEILARILERIAGDPQGPRGAQSRISEALSAAGVRPSAKTRISGGLELAAPGVDFKFGYGRQG